jgi:hypothetical protein
MGKSLHLDVSMLLIYISTKVLFVGLSSILLIYIYIYIYIYMCVCVCVCVCVCESINDIFPIIFS